MIYLYVMGVEFEENNNQYLMSRQILGQPKIPTMTNIFLKFGIKSEKNAFRLLATCGIIFFLLTLIIVLYSYQHYFKTSKTGLIELLVVISIIGLLSSIVLAAVGTARDKARISGGQLFEDSINQTFGSAALGSWPMNDGSGTTIKDALGNINATAVSTAWTSGINNSKALAFDGGSSYVQIPNSTSFPNYSQSLTISAWVYLNSAGSNWQPISYKEGNEGRAWWFGFWPGTSNQILFDNTNVTSMTCTIPDAVGYWRHIVAMYQNGVGKKLYVDGKLICQMNTTGTITITTGDIFVGGGGWQPINGKIQNFRIFAAAQ